MEIKKKKFFLFLMYNDPAYCKKMFTKFPPTKLRENEISHFRDANLFGITIKSRISRKMLDGILFKHLQFLPPPPPLSLSLSLSPSPSLSPLLSLPLSLSLSLCYYKAKREGLYCQARPVPGRAGKFDRIRSQGVILYTIHL